MIDKLWKLSPRANAALMMFVVTPIIIYMLVLLFLSAVGFIHLINDIILGRGCS
jgi:hypothetical protein